MTVINVLLVSTAAATALMAGLFYAWSVSVMPGFAKLSDKEFIAAMQATNRAIQNPAFFAAFFGTPILLLITTFFLYQNPQRFWLLLAATIIYLIGTFGVTISGNIPLNNALESFDQTSATAEEEAQQRSNFENRWNILNHIRTISALIALILVILACLN